MPINTQINSNANEVLITVSGIFNFDLHEEFGKALEAAKSRHNAKFTVDLGAVEDIDSSALGMLLLLRDAAGGDRANIEIRRCRPEIAEELRMANFHKLFALA
ncbi:MAG: hypothetical protein AMJ53_10350 [Gammaproteobacteria bacterium SG8_11]|nr:MAG: hypothetical protein AMJ53_10350 [Gammaproteobacteria bacterium SG8_11]